MVFLFQGLGEIRVRVSGLLGFRVSGAYVARVWTEGFNAFVFNRIWKFMLGAEDGLELRV